jgi:hypothetical protein
VSQLFPFQPKGDAFVLTTSATPNTSVSIPVVLGGGSSTGSLALPYHADAPAIRLLNKGTVDIWLSFTNPAAATVAAPTAGTTTIGTPQPVIWIEPGVDLIFTLPMTFAALVGAPAGLNGPGFWLNMVAAAASQSFYAQIGEGN